MGVSQPSILSSIEMKDMVLESKGMCQSSSGYVWYKDIQLHTIRRRLNRRQRIIKRNYGNLGWNRRPKILMKRAPMNGVERRMRTLQKLLPNGKSTEFDGLFREATDYIVYLEMQVKVMQIMVKVLSNSNA